MSTTLIEPTKLSAPARLARHWKNITPFAPWAIAWYDHRRMMPGRLRALCACQFCWDGVCSISIHGCPSLRPRMSVWANAVSV